MNSGKVVENIMTVLIDKGLVKNKSAFASSIGTYCHVIYYIINGKRSITLKMIGLLAKKFDVNPNYIFGVSDEMFGTSVAPIDYNTIQVDLDSFTSCYPAGGYKELGRFKEPNLSNEIRYALTVNKYWDTPFLVKGDIVVVEPLKFTLIYFGQIVGVIKEGRMYYGRMGKGQLLFEKTPPMPISKNDHFFKLVSRLTKYSMV